MDNNYVWRANGDVITSVWNGGMRIQMASNIVYIYNINLSVSGNFDRCAFGAATYWSNFCLKSVHEKKFFFISNQKNMTTLRRRNVTYTGESSKR